MKNADIYIKNWDDAKRALDDVVDYHKNFPSIDHPTLPEKAIAWAYDFIRYSKNLGEPVPSGITGTVDATICFEYHTPSNPDTVFGSVEFYKDKAEVFIYYKNKETELIETELPDDLLQDEDYVHLLRDTGRS